MPKWLPSGAKNLIKRILDPNPKTRITVADIKEDEWFKKDYVPAVVDDEEEDVVVDDEVLSLHEAVRNQILFHCLFRNLKVQISESLFWWLQPTDSEKDPESPTHINAFELIGMSSSLDLSGFFEKEVKELF